MENDLIFLDSLIYGLYGTLTKQNLSLVFVTLMMLAFLIDQTQQLCCGLYRAARAKHSSKASFFEEVRAAFKMFEVDGMTDILKVIAHGIRTRVQFDST